jgi:uncharacterized protein (TIGR00255 family)
MNSMTGFGEGAAQGKRVRVTAQIRTVNHRHADIHLRVPKLYLSLEGEIREQVRKRIHRGRIDIYIDRIPLKGREVQLEVDEELMEQYCRALRHIKKRFGLGGEIDLQILPRLPELFVFKEPDQLATNEKRLALRALETALISLARSRSREGRNLRRDILLQVRRLSSVSKHLSQTAGNIDARLRDASRDSAPGPGSARDGGEAGSSTFKGSINEEVVRLKSHVETLSGLVQDREPIGKKIDFLLQEIQRELTTIGSKAPELSVVHLVLSGKESLEKIREQVQNVE